MLVNMWGIELVDEVVDTDDHRTGAAVNPKARVTLTTLFGAVLASFITAGSPEPPQHEVSGVPVVVYNFVTKPARSGDEARRDAA